MCVGGGGCGYVCCKQKSNKPNFYLSIFTELALPIVLFPLMLARELNEHSLELKNVMNLLELWILRDPPVSA